MAKKASRTKAADPSTMFRLLADPKRLRTIQLLAANRRGLLAGEIASALRVEQSTASHLLGMLHDHDVVIFKKEGRTVRYLISAAPATKTLLRVIRAAA